MVGDEIMNGAVSPGTLVNTPAAQALGGEVAEEALDCVQPGAVAECAGRRGTGSSK